MRIVPAAAHHIDPAWSIIDRCRRALAAEGIAQWDDVYPSRATVEGDVRRGVLHVLEDADRCVACVTLDDRQDPEYATVAWTTAEPTLVVHRLCVDPDAQGRGLGRRLMEFAESEARRRGFASVRLDAYTANPRSVAMYERLGYRSAGLISFPRRALPFHCFERAISGGGSQD